MSTDDLHNLLGGSTPENNLAEDSAVRAQVEANQTANRAFRAQMGS